MAGDPAYGRLKDQLMASTGLAFYENRDNLLIELIGGRLSDLGLRGWSSYANFLAHDETGRAEMEVLIGRLTIGETRFFRDTEVFTAIRDTILPDILERKQSSRQLRIWSAGCSNGAEPYSIAIILKDDLAERIAGWQVEIYATDLNQGCLIQAEKGVFRERALHTTSDKVKTECFSKEGSSWTIHPRYKEWISFHQINLAASELTTPLPSGTQADLILCRNVMIYFAPESNRRLIRNFNQSLGDAGWLVVGGAEHNLEDYQDFRAIEVSGTKAYQKRTVLGVFVEESQAAAKEILPNPVAQVHPLPRSSGDPGLVDMESLLHLIDRGDWQEAAEYGQRLLAGNRLRPELYFYQALIFENLGTDDQAQQALRRAIYLDRNFALAHYHLGLALKRDGQIRASARSFGNVLKVLAAMPDDTTVTAGPGVTATDLRELARMHLEESSGS